MKIYPLLLSIFLLASCGGSSSASSTSSSKAITPSSEATNTSAEATTASAEDSSSLVSLASSSQESETSKIIEGSSEVVEESSNLTEESSKDIEETSALPSTEEKSSKEDVPGQGAWELNSSVLPPNPSSGVLHDITFETTNGKGQTISFVADSILTGGGTKGTDKVSIDDTIQLSKNCGYIYMTSGYASYIEFKIARVIQTYGGEDHDYTGVPTIYSADEMDGSNGEVVTLNQEESEDHHYYTYSCFLPYSRFRLANESGNALYIYYIRNLA